MINITTGSNKGPKRKPGGTPQEGEGPAHRAKHHSGREALQNRPWSQPSRITRWSAVSNSKMRAIWKCAMLRLICNCKEKKGQGLYQGPVKIFIASTRRINGKNNKFRLRDIKTTEARLRHYKKKVSITWNFEWLTWNFDLLQNFELINRNFRVSAADQ